MAKLYILILFCCSFAWGLEGQVTLVSGEVHEGGITGHTLSFKDIFRNEKLRVRMKEIYRLDLLYESISSHLVWNSREEQQMQKYILAITTWKGERYWARLRCNFEISTKQQKHNVIFPNKRYLERDKEKEKLTSKFYASSLVFQDKKKPNIKEDLLPALEGSLDPRLENKFTKVYAIHYELGTLFKGSIVNNKYSFKNIFPGNYDLVFVGKEGIAFCLTETKRKKILDQATQYVEENLYGWIQGFSNFSVRFEIMFYTGYFSDTRVIVLERNQDIQKIVLWAVQHNLSQKKWKIANKAILYEQQIDVLLPQLFVDRNLGNIPVGFGKKTYDYIIYGN